MKTPIEVAQQTLDNHVIRDDWRRTGEQVRGLIAEAIEADRKEIAAALREDNPIITAYIGNVLDPSPEDGPDIAALWVHYIDEGDIGFEYTETEAKLARAFITTGKSRWRRKP